jgi:hypothetical protein
MTSLEREKSSVERRTRSGFGTGRALFNGKCDLLTFDLMVSGTLQVRRGKMDN